MYAVYPWSEGPRDHGGGVSHQVNSGGRGGQRGGVARGTGVRVGGTGVGRPRVGDLHGQVGREGREGRSHRLEGLGEGRDTVCSAGGEGSAWGGLAR